MLRFNILLEKFLDTGDRDFDNVNMNFRKSPQTEIAYDNSNRLTLNAEARFTVSVKPFTGTILKRTCNSIVSFLSSPL
jgi:hypothetical protein